MKHWLTIALMTCLLSCKQGTFTPITSYQVIRESDEIGEYLQALSAEQALTFVRKSKNQAEEGLVLANLRTAEVKVLDSEASDGRDLFVSGQWAVYRLSSALRVISLTSWKAISLSLPSTLNQILKIRSFLVSESTFQVGIDVSGGQSFLAVFSLDGFFLSLSPLTGSPRFHHKLRDGREIILLREPQRAALYTKNSQGTWDLFAILQDSLTAQYAAMIELKESVGVAFFDDQLGVLKWAETPTSGGSTTVTLIDGEANKTYRGMDICIALFEGSPVLSYLDGWSLKFHMARRLKDGTWRTQEVPVQGAVGFYSQILNLTQDSAQIAFHNFRTDHPDSRKQTYEDLVWIETLLP